MEAAVADLGPVEHRLLAAFYQRSNRPAYNPPPVEPLSLSVMGSHQQKGES